VSTLESAILGLLALMIGFTFAMALSRFEARRAAVLEEANAIGTTALRTRLLPAPHSTESLKLLREYVQIENTCRSGWTSPNVYPLRPNWMRRLHGRTRSKRRFGSRPRQWPRRRKDLYQRVYSSRR